MKENKTEIDPDEIRAIRKKLGLSQVEAGELLGGGPRAFTKYEAGTVKPAASVVNLLRLLEAKPAMISILQGSKSHPMPPTVEPYPFEVTGEHIAVLTGKKFSSLLRRLLRAEAEVNGLPTDGIHVAESITTPDGGEDGHIRWDDGPDHTKFLPSRFSQFQLKASEITLANAGNDVLTNTGSVKDMVRSAIEAGGCYIMLCAHHYVQKAIKGRETRILGALRGAGITIDDSQVQFRDADQIAAWVNSHPAVATWVKEQTQPGTTGPFRSWSHWAGRAEHDSSPWVDDERLSKLLAWLHERVIKPKSVVRIVGLSDIGKSRLTLEALGPTDEEDCSVSDIVLYADESEAGSVAINNTVQNLADMGTRAVVVVDCCIPDTHRILTGIVSRACSRLSLVTIDSEILPGILDETTFEVEEAPLSVIEAIIGQLSPGLPSEDQRRLVRFSKGFPGIAICIEKAWAEDKPVAHARDDDLVDAFVLGRSPREPELLRKSAALLATFGLVEIENPTKLSEIAQAGRNLTVTDLLAAVERLTERGIVQRRGRLAILKPRPVAMRLAESQWREWRRDKWDEVLAGDTSSNLKILAARQLALLNTTDISKKVVDHVCRRGGPFDGSEGVSKAGHAEVLSFFAEINSRVVADQIDRSLAEIGNLSEVKGNVLGHLVWALEKIAFCSDTFEDGARLLLRLAVAEKEQHIHNNATNQFKALFPMLAGNTAANGNSRLSILNEATNTDNSVQRSIVVEALIAGAKTDHFSRFVGAETHGSRPALEDWRPTTNEAATNYIRSCVMLLAQCAKWDDDSGITARAGLGRHLRSLIEYGLIDTVERVIDQVGNTVDPWIEALESLDHFLKHGATDDDHEMISRVKTLIDKLWPKDIEARVRFLVTEMPWDFPCGEELDFDTLDQRQDEAVHALAVEIVKKPAALKRILPQVSRGQQRKAHVFGKSIATSAESPLEWLEPITSAVVEVPEGKRNFSLLSGYVTSIVENYPDVVDDFKRKVTQSPELVPALPLICRRIGITQSDIGLVIGVLQKGLLAPRHLGCWESVGVLAEVPASVVAPLFDTMLDHSMEAFAVAVSLMGKYAHGAPDRFDDLRPQILKSAENIAWWEQPPRETMVTYHFETIMKRMLGHGRQDCDACTTALVLARALVKVAKQHHGRLLEPMIPILLSDFPEITWPLIGQAIVSDREQAWHFEPVLKGLGSSTHEKDPLILSLPQDTLFAWCHAHPEFAPAFTAAIVPVLTTYQVDAPKRLLHPVMARLLDEFGDRQDVLQAISRNIHTFIWCGSMGAYYALYQAPLSTLDDHQRWQVKSWAKTMLRQLDTEVENACTEDEEREAQHEV